MRVLRALSIALVLVSIVFAAATYGALPDRIPTRLDLSGETVGVTERTPLSWFMLPGINVLMLGLFAFISAQLRTKPHWFNFPDKARFLALPAEYRAPVIDEMRVVLETALLGVLLTMLAVQALLWRVAMGERAGALALAPLFGVLLTPLILIAVTRVTTATEVAEKRWKAGGSLH